MFADLGVTELVLVIVTILVSLTFHEFMHAYAGYKLGDDTARFQGRLSLNPLVHIDPLLTVALPIFTLILFGAPILAAKPVPFDPYSVRFGDYGAAMVAAAGPLSNLVLAIIGAVILTVVSPAGFAAYALTVFVVLNVAIMIFNLVPIPPLDGSRILYAFAPQPVRNVMDQIEPIGFFIIIGLVVLGGFGGWLTGINQAVLELLL